VTVNCWGAVTLVGLIVTVAVGAGGGKTVTVVGADVALGAPTPRQVTVSVYVPGALGAITPGPSIEARVPGGEGTESPKGAGLQLNSHRLRLVVQLTVT